MMVFKFGRGYRSTFSLLFGNETPNIDLYPFNNVNRYRILGPQRTPEEQTQFIELVNQEIGNNFEHL